MVLKEMLQRIKDRRSKFSDLKDDEKMGETISQRKKSGDERDLEEFMEKERQKKISMQMKLIRAKERREMFTGMSMLDKKNIFKGHKSILTNNPKLNIIGRHSSGGGMFFK